MKKEKTYTLALLGILVALILVFWYGIGTIDLQFIKITLSCIPVIVGTLALGMKGGLILAFCFGSVSFFTSLITPKGLSLVIFQASAVWGAVLSYIPRLLIPLMICLARKLTRNMNNKVSLAISACVGSLTNTIFYLGMMVFLYWALGFENPELLSLVGTTVLVGGLPEAAVATIVSPAILLALKKAHLINE